MNALSGAMQYPRGTESWAAAHTENSCHWKIHTSYSPHILEIYAINELQIGNVHCVQEKSKSKCFVIFHKPMLMLIKYGGQCFAQIYSRFCVPNSTIGRVI